MFELTVINVFSEKRLDFLFLVPCDVSVHLYILYYLCK